MKKKPDILVVLAAVLGLGIAVSSLGNANVEAESKAQQVEIAQLNQIKK